MFNVQFSSERKNFPKLQNPPADTTYVGDELVELGLNQTSGLLSLMDRILAMLPELATESEKLRSTEFRDELGRYREQIRSHRPVEPIARKMLDLCQDYFRRARMQRLEREHEYVEMI